MPPGGVARAARRPVPAGVPARRNRLAARPRRPSGSPRTPASRLAADAARAGSRRGYARWAPARGHDPATATGAVPGGLGGASRHPRSERSTRARRSWLTALGAGRVKTRMPAIAAQHHCEPGLPASAQRLTTAVRAATWLPVAVTTRCFHTGSADCRPSPRAPGGAPPRLRPAALRPLQACPRSAWPRRPQRTAWSSPASPAPAARCRPARSPRSQ